MFRLVKIVHQIIHIALVATAVVAVGLIDIKLGVCFGMLVAAEVIIQKVEQYYTAAAMEEILDTMIKDAEDISKRRGGMDQ